MMAEFVLSLADTRASLDRVGGKGASLARLAQANLPVPDGFHVTTAAYQAIVDENNLKPAIQAALGKVDPDRPSTLDTASRQIREQFLNAQIPPAVASAIAHGYASLPGTNPAVAVRSSATAEDLPEASFAGQQDTFLNVSGTVALLEAAKRCWSSLWTARAIGYRMRHKIDPESVQLAIVVQLLVPAEVAGILFTSDPMTGAPDEALITSAWGLGESIVGGMVTPDSFTVAKSSGKVIRREIADKQVMTASFDGGTREEPVPDDLRRAPTLDDTSARELARYGVQIEKLYGRSMDIEWVLCDGMLWIVQARPITTLAEEPIEWDRPDPKGVYMRSSVVDLMPGPLSPLFASLGMRALMDQMTPMARRMTRSDPALPEDYYTTINSYAYVNTTLPLRSWWWMLSRVIPAYPRMLRSVARTWREELRPEYVAYLDRQKGKQPAEMTMAELWRETQEAVHAAMDYVVALLFATMGASAGSELLLTNVYNRMVKRDGDPPAQTLLMGWDNIPVQSEKSLYDMAMWCRERQALADVLLKTSSQELGELLEMNHAPAGVDALDWAELRRRFQHHLDRFGHIVFQLDFAEPLPLDDPAPMVETLKMFLRGEGVNPHDRQRASEGKRVSAADEAFRHLRGLKRWAFKTALGWGQSLAEVREDALAEIGLGYPLIRDRLSELGRRLVEAGVIQDAHEIYYLEKPEIDVCVACLEEGTVPGKLADQVAKRRSFLKRAAQLTPPPTIPPKKRIMGVKTEVFAAVSEEAQSGNTLKGAATSPGKVTAPASVLRGPEDFDKMQLGHVLVAGTTTPAWTPLFAMAAAVVTDIGGPLSHGSIVAREYGIPAVMGTGVATKRIRSGQMVTVDGSAGTVALGDAGS
jgi:phosphohistidine swiveling domain-containing protein